VQVRYWKDSETLFAHAIRVTGSNAVAQYILGALCDSEGKTDEARAHFTAAIRDNPIHVKARCALGHILSDEGNYADAAAEYEAALSVAPNLAKAHFGLAEVLLKQRDFDGAMEHYSLALKADPNIAQAHYQLAALFSVKQDMPSTISHLQEAVRLNPDFVLALNNLGWIRATEANPKMRDGLEATRLAMRAVALTGRNNPNTLDTLAAAYAESGKFEYAVGTAQCAIQTASAMGQTNLVAEIGSRLKLYQSQQAYRE
jgi:tetratricopeptide (TPR) repeat protein